MKRAPQFQAILKGKIQEGNQSSGSKMPLGDLRRVYAGGRAMVGGGLRPELMKSAVRHLNTIEYEDGLANLPAAEYDPNRRSIVLRWRFGYGKGPEIFVHEYGHFLHDVIHDCTIPKEMYDEFDEACREVNKKLGTKWAGEEWAWSSMESDISARLAELSRVPSTRAMVNLEEWWAECFRLFFFDSDRLRETAPKSHRFMADLVMGRN